MEEHRHIVPSNFSSQQRFPLRVSNANAHYHKIEPVETYGPVKEISQPSTVAYRNLPFETPTLPSQPATSRRLSALRIRKYQNQGSSRLNRIRNLVLNSEAYQNYREKQKDDDADAHVWPDQLEDLFLEALLEIPQMGRRKFSIRGTAHGRNEIIAEYIWLGYKQSLPHGVKPDETKRRQRKQVSSHIQVLKQKLKNDEVGKLLFPPKPKEKGGDHMSFDDSYKHNACLIAVGQGCLPRKRDYQFEYATEGLKPSIAKLWMTSRRPGPGNEDVSVHTYTESQPYPKGRVNLDDIPNWRVRFPALAKSHALGDQKCCLIHLEVCLHLQNGRPLDKTELHLNGRFEFVVRGVEEPGLTWRCQQSLFKPAELYGPAELDNHIENENKVTTPIAYRYEPNSGTYLQVEFPATPWAHIINNLSTMQEDFDAAKRGKLTYPTYSAREYIEQISMYQELWSRNIGTQVEERRAIVLWTFRKCGPADDPISTYRYLDPPSSYRSVLSPHPGTKHEYTANMTENFNEWPPVTKPGLLTNHSFVQPIHEVAQPPTLQPHFPMFEYASQGTDLTAESLSFVSHETQDSDSTLVDQNSSHMDSFLDTADGSLGLIEPAHRLWVAPSDNFDSEQGYLASYNTVSNSTPHMWDIGDKHQGVWDNEDPKIHSWRESDPKQHLWTSNDQKSNSWLDSDPGFGVYHSNLSQRMA